MVTLDSSIAFLIYITAVSSAAAGVTEAVKSVVPFLGTDFEPHPDSITSQNMALRLTQWKKFCNLVVSICAAGVIFSMMGIDPGLILAGHIHAHVVDPWGAKVWVWGIVAVFGSPLFHSLLKILEGVQYNVGTNRPPKPTQKVKK